MNSNLSHRQEEKENDQQRQATHRLNTTNQNIHSRYANRELPATPFFAFSDPTVSTSMCGSFVGSAQDKDSVNEIVDEWNARLCISELCEKWKKDRPKQQPNSSLLILLFNVEGLRTHVTDVDILLNKYKPHICILTGVGAATKNMPKFPGYAAHAQQGTNYFGGVAILCQEDLNCKIIKKELNFLLIELQTPVEPVLIGAMYVPPGSLPLFQEMNECNNKPFYVFGDFNAKHTAWGCEKNNTAGIHINSWLEATGNDIIAPSKPTSRRSSAVIDFGLTHDATEWNSEVLNEGTSDHWPILFQSTIAIENKSQFKLTNWKVFTFLLSCVFQYWNSVVYNLDTETFFSLFSAFLSALQDRCSTYKRIDEFRPPWPPQLLLLARTVNAYRRKYRRNRSPSNLERFLIWKEIFTSERANYLQQKRERKAAWLDEGKNLWRSVKNTFRPFAPPFKGITTKDGKETDARKIVDILADHYEKHFESPAFDESNVFHKEAISAYMNLDYTPNIPLQQIKREEVEQEWKKFRPKKSLDSAGTSAFLLKKLPNEYLTTITVLFNKCAMGGDFFSKGKIAKIICLSKDGMYPTQNKLRPISLLPNIAKWFERIMHRRILQWCHNNNIAVDEQSGFMQGRRLQTRILSLVENLRLTVTACNRPALTIFVDFLSAFDKMWHPALMKTLSDLGMPISLLKWTHTWLQNRFFYLSYGEELSRVIKMNVGAPQGSVLAATLFRLHVHFLPAIFMNLTIHMFADDLAIVIAGSLEKRFSFNIIDLERTAKLAMKQLEAYANKMLLPVNISKTKALLVHSVVAPQLPRVKYKNQTIEHVQSFKYLGVTISTKLGWGNYVSERLRKVRGIYRALRIILTEIPIEMLHMRRKLFLAYALPHFCWLFCTWFYLTEIQQRTIEHVFCSGLRLTYAFHGWDDLTTMIVCREKSLRDYLYLYWTRLSAHLEKAPDALDFQQSLQAFKIVTSNDKSWYKTMGFRKNSKFPKRLAERAKHTIADWERFKEIHKDQHLFYQRDTKYLCMFIYKFSIEPS